MLAHSGLGHPLCFLTMEKDHTVNHRGAQPVWTHTRGKHFVRFCTDRHRDWERQFRHKWGERELTWLIQWGKERGKAVKMRVERLSCLLSMIAGGVFTEITWKEQNKLNYISPKQSKTRLDIKLETVKCCVSRLCSNWERGNRTEQVQTVRNREKSETTGRFCTVGDQMLDRSIIPSLCKSVGCAGGGKTCEWQQRCFVCSLQNQH